MANSALHASVQRESVYTCLVCIITSVIYIVQLEAAKVLFGVYVQYVRPAGART